MENSRSLNRILNRRVYKNRMRLRKIKFRLRGTGLLDAPGNEDRRPRVIGARTTDEAATYAGGPPLYFLA